MMHAMLSTCGTTELDALRSKLFSSGKQSHSIQTDTEKMSEEPIIMRVKKDSACICAERLMIREVSHVCGHFFDGKS